MIGRAAFGLAATLAAAAALAAPPQLNYLDVDYVQFDASGAESTGYGITLSSPLPSSRNYLHARYAKLDAETDGGPELERIRLGMGYVTPTQTGGVFYTLITFERDDSAERDEGYGAELGLRFSVGQYVELGGAARYVDFDRRGSDSGYTATAVVTLTPGFALFGRFEDVGDGEEIRAGVRLTNAAQ